jgi:hypothetical protein
VHKPGFQTFSSEVFVADDQTRDVSVTLNKEVGTNWVAWSIGSLLVVTGGIVAGYFIFQPSNGGAYQGTLPPFTTATSAHGVHFK